MDTQPTILVIDDNNTSQQFASRALKGTYAVECAENGKEGLLLAEKILPDAILMDVEMPGLNGYAACEMLKNSSNTPAHTRGIYLFTRLTTRTHAGL